MVSGEISVGGGWAVLAAAFLGFLLLPLLGSSLKGFLVVGASNSGVGVGVVTAGVGVEEVFSSCFGVGGVSLS